MVKAHGADNVVITGEILALQFGCVVRVELIRQDLTMSHWMSLTGGAT